MVFELYLTELLQKIACTFHFLFHFLNEKFLSKFMKNIYLTSNIKVSLFIYYCLYFGIVLILRKEIKRGHRLDSSNMSGSGAGLHK